MNTTEILTFLFICLPFATMIAAMLLKDNEACKPETKTPDKGKNNNGH